MFSWCLEREFLPSALLKLYLPWLEQDADLAQRVADAWNAVVERGEADLAKCCCLQCSPSEHQAESESSIEEEESES